MINASNQPVASVDYQLQNGSQRDSVASHCSSAMFSIELNPDQPTRQRNKAIADQRSKMYELTDFECHVFGVFCESVGKPEYKDFAESFVRQRREDDDGVYVGDKEIMETQGTLQNDSGGGRRIIRGTKSMS